MQSVHNLRNISAQMPAIRVTVFAFGLLTKCSRVGAASAVMEGFSNNEVAEAFAATRRLAVM